MRSAKTTRWSTPGQSETYQARGAASLLTAPRSPSGGALSRASCAKKLAGRRLQHDLGHWALLGGDPLDQDQHRPSMPVLGRAAVTAAYHSRRSSLPARALESVDGRAYE